MRNGGGFRGASRSGTLYKTTCVSDGAQALTERRRTLQARGLLSLPPEPVSLVVRLSALCVLSLLEKTANEGRRGAHKRRAAVLVERQDALGLVAPREDGAAVLDALAEEAEEHVDAADGEEEEGGDEREVVDVVREDRRADEALEDAERAEPEVGPEHGEVRREEGRGPADLGEDEDDDLEDDEQPVHDGPEDACRLVRDGATSEDAAT